MREKPRQKGHALIELALLLPMTLTLLLGVVEIGNAIVAYMTVVEASREGVRLVVREGPSADVQGLVQGIASPRLQPSRLTTQVSYSRDSFGDDTVTVEVDYEYRFIFTNAPFLRDVLPDPFILRARTTMPIP